MTRQSAFKIIYKTINDSSYTNILMRNSLDEFDLKDRAFITNLVNGVLKKYDLLLFQHEKFYEKCNLKLKIILSMAVYEKFYLNKKDYVINNEYAKLIDNEYDRNFFYAILHKCTSFNKSLDPWVNYSIPKWLYQLLSKQYEDNKLNIILNNYLNIHPIYYHINKKKCNKNDLKKYNVKFINDYIFTSDNNLINTEEFSNGYFYIQDVNASTIVSNFDFNSDDNFLDACAAPGSKLFNALDYIDSKNAYANDINDSRLNLIKKEANKLGYNDINYLNYDASTLSNNLNMKFDKILLDVPCSGLGIIGRRNDIKFHVTPNSLDELENIQFNILSVCSKLLKDEGELIYSTCTLNKKENGAQIKKFLDKNNNFKLIIEDTIISDVNDMFYFAKIKKV